MSERRRVSTDARWAETVGYSRAVRAGDTVWVSGTAPVAPDGGIVHPGDPYRQARRCFEIVVDALREVGARPEHVVRTRIFVRNAEDWKAVGRAHGEWFREVKPATMLVAAAGFVDPEILVEVEAVAVL